MLLKDKTILLKLNETGTLSSELNKLTSVQLIDLNNNEYKTFIEFTFLNNDKKEIHKQWLSNGTSISSLKRVKTTLRENQEKNIANNKYFKQIDLDEIQYLKIEFHKYRTNLSQDTCFLTITNRINQESIDNFIKTSLKIRRGEIRKLKHYVFTTSNEIKESIEIKTKDFYNINVILVNLEGEENVGKMRNFANNWLLKNKSNTRRVVALDDNLYKIVAIEKTSKATFKGKPKLAKSESMLNSFTLYRTLMRKLQADKYGIVTIPSLTQSLKKNVKKISSISTGLMSYKLLENINFKETPFGEDRSFGIDFLNEGYKVNIVKDISFCKYSRSLMKDNSKINEIGGCGVSVYEDLEKINKVKDIYMNKHDDLQIIVRSNSDEITGNGQKWYLEWKTSKDLLKNLFNK